MRKLFEIDFKDYDPNGTKCFRPSMRAIIVRDGRLAMIHSLKFDYYKFPGGGAEEGESPIETLVREVREEAGLNVIPETVKEFGYVYRIQKGRIEDMFIQNNYYYLCDVEEKSTSTDLDDYEAEEGFTLEFVTADEAIQVNSTHFHGELNDHWAAMLQRETRVLGILKEELGL